MEPFIDGGMLELILVVAFGYVINFIFLKKQLLVFFSIFAVSTPIILIIFPDTRWKLVLSIVCLINSILLVFILWKTRNKDESLPLIDVKKIINKFRTKLKD